MSTYESYCLIRDLKPFNKSWRIKVTIIQKTNVQSCDQEKNLSILKLILIDEEICLKTVFLLR